MSDAQKSDTPDQGDPAAGDEKVDGVGSKYGRRWRDAGRGTAEGGGAGDPGPTSEQQEGGHADGGDRDLAAEQETEAAVADDGAGFAAAAEDGGFDAAAAAGLPELTELEIVTAQRDEYLDALRRLQADFDNFRKRVRRQEEELSAYYVASMVERLLPVLDAVELAAAHASADDAGVFGQVAHLLRDTLAKEGLERIDAPGVVFEPAIHDAVAHVPADEQADGGDSATDLPIVEEVLRTGYSLKGKVLRPAMVKVRG